MTGHDFVGFGEAVSKVASEDLAAARFVKHLQDTGSVSAADLPAPLDSVNLNTPPESSVSIHGGANILHAPDMYRCVITILYFLGCFFHCIRG